MKRLLIAFCLVALFCRPALAAKAIGFGTPVPNATGAGQCNISVANASNASVWGACGGAGNLPAIPGTAGYLLSENAASAVWSACTGDMTCSQVTPGAITVVAIRGNAVKSGTPSDTQIYVYNSTNSDFEPVSLFGDATITHSGAVTVNGIKGTTISGSNLLVGNGAGGVASYGGTTCSANQWLSGLPTTGGPGNCTQPAEANLSFSDITTNNVSTSAHGFAPKLPNDATKFFNGVGQYTVPGASGVPVRISVPIASTPTASQMWSTALADVFNIPANFAGSSPDANSVAVCITNPSEVDAYQVQCGASYIGSVTINTSGTAAFATGTRPFIRASTQAAPGVNGGAINVPTGVVNGDLLVLIVSAQSSCEAAGSISGGGTWTAPPGSTQANGVPQSCIYTRIASSEPASYTYTNNSTYPSLVMVDIVNATASTTPDTIVWNTGSSTSPSIPATSSLGSSQDLLLGYIFLGNGTLTAPSGLLQVQLVPYGSGTNYGNYVGQLSLTANSSSAQTGTLSSSLTWITGAIAIAPATNGGTTNCAVANLLKVTAPVTVSGICPMTLAGHSS